MSIVNVDIQPEQIGSDCNLVVSEMTSKYNIDNVLIIGPQRFIDYAKCMQDTLVRSKFVAELSQRYNDGDIDGGELVYLDMADTILVINLGNQHDIGIGVKNEILYALGNDKQVLDFKTLLSCRLLRDEASRMEACHSTSISIMRDQWDTIKHSTHQEIKEDQK